MFNNLFKIYKGEGTKVFIFFIFALLLQFVVTLALSISDAMFLSKLGADQLPLFFIISPLVMVIFIALYSHITGLLGIKKTILYTLIVLSIAGLFIFSLSFLNSGFIESNVFYFSLKMYAYIWFISSYSLFWNYIDEYFAILDAKRLYPHLAGGLTTGGILAGLCVTSFSHTLTFHHFFLICAIFAFLNIFIYLYLSKKYSRVEQEAEEHVGFTIQFKNIVEYTKKSKFVIVINFVLFFTIFLTTLSEYQYSEVFANKYKEQDLIKYIGSLFIYVNCLNLLINIFLFNRLVSWLGIPNVALIQPITYIIIFGMFAINYGELSALLAFFAYYSIMIGIDYNNWNFLFNAIPYRIRKTFRFVFEGIIDPIASAIAGIFLLILFWYLKGVEQTLIPSDVISQIALYISLFFVILVFFFKKQYSQAIISSLQYGVLSFNKQITFQNLGMKEVNKLKHLFDTKAKPTFHITFFILWKYNYEIALQHFINALKQTPIEKQTIFLDIMPILINNCDLHIKRILIKEFKSSQIPISAEVQKMLVILEVLELNTLPIDKQEAYIISLYNNWDIYNNEKALRIISIMLNTGIPNEVEKALHVISYLKNPKYINLITKYISSEMPSIKKQAILTTCKLIDESSEQFFIHLINEILYLETEERRIILESTHKIKDTNLLQSIIVIADNLTTTERRIIYNNALNMGLYIIPMIVSTINNTALTYSIRIFACKILATLSFAQFENLYPKLIKKEIQYAYETLCYSQILQDVTSNNKDEKLGLYALENFYSSISKICINFILELLALGTKLPNIDMIISFLQSKNIKASNNALEALTQSIPSYLIKNLIPLIDSRGVENTLKYYKKVFKKNHKLNSSIDDILNQAIKEDFPLEKSIAIYIKYKQNSTEETIQYLQNLFTGENNPLCKQALLGIIHNHNIKTNQQDIHIIEQFYYLLKSPFFKDLTLDIVESLLLISNIEYVNKNDLLFNKGDSISKFYFIIKGKVELKHSNTQSTLNQYDIVDFKNNFMNDIHQKEARILENDTILITFDYAKFYNLAKVYPRLSLHILEGLNSYVK